MTVELTDVYSIGNILPSAPQGRIELNGEILKTGRFMLFYKKGLTCRGCGLKASFFRKEKNQETTILNLYGIRNGRHVLFTRDHIVPVSRGGTGDLNNLQPMCCDCNNRKGDYISFKNQVKQTVVVIKKFFHVVYVRFTGTAGLLKAIWRKADGNSRRIGI